MGNFNSLPKKTLTPWLSEPSPQGSGKQRAASLQVRACSRLSADTAEVAQILEIAHSSRLLGESLPELQIATSSLSGRLLDGWNRTGSPGMMVEAAYF